MFEKYHITNQNCCIAEMPAYCTSSSAPTLSNAVSMPPLTTLYATTYFTCNAGYQTNGPSQPYYTCEPNTYLGGLWTPVSYSCEEIPVYCDPTTAPSLTNAVSNTPRTSVYSVTDFTCNMGYVWKCFSTVDSCAPLEGVDRWLLVWELNPIG